MYWVRFRHFYNLILFEGSAIDDRFILWIPAKHLHFVEWFILTFRNSERVDDRQGLMAATSRHDEISMAGGSQCVVSYPDVSSSREARTIGRLKLALVLVALGFLTMTLLFIWQITQKKSAARVQVSRVARSDFIATFESCCNIFYIPRYNPL